MRRVIVAMLVTVVCGLLWAPLVSAARPSGEPQFEWTGTTKAPPRLNHVRAGSWVAVQFSLNGDFGLGVIRDGWPRQRSSIAQGTG